MSNHPKDSGSHGTGPDDLVSATRRGLSARSSDPYLTDHDRWVLRQFARFLSGIAPEPDPRAPRICALEHMHRSRVHAGHR